MRSLSFFMPCSLPIELNPNWQWHGPGQNGLKARAINLLKEYAYIYAVDARNKWEREHGNIQWDPLEKAEIEVIIVLGLHMRQWDETNARAALKYAEDMWTIETVRKQGAGLILDDSPEHLTWGKIQFERGFSSGIRVEIKGE